MTVELLQTLSIAAYIAAGVFLLTAIALFFLLDVPKLYGDVSGRTAKKAIEAIRQQNESTGNKAYKPSAVNAERGKLTDKISPSGRLESQVSGNSIGVGTEKLSRASVDSQSNETTVLDQPVGETTVLQRQIIGETTVLSPESNNFEQSNGGYFSLDVEMFFYGTSEIIE